LANDLFKRIAGYLPEVKVQPGYAEEFYPGMLEGWQQSVTAIPDFFHQMRAQKVVEGQDYPSPFGITQEDLAPYRESEQEFLDRMHQEERMRSARELAAATGDLRAQGEMQGDLLSYAVDPIGDLMGGPIGPAVAKVAGKFMPEALMSMAFNKKLEDALTKNLKVNYVDDVGLDRAGVYRRGSDEITVAEKHKGKMKDWVERHETGHYLYDDLQNITAGSIVEQNPELWDALKEISSVKSHYRSKEHGPHGVDWVEALADLHAERAHRDFPQIVDTFLDENMRGYNKTLTE
jgi:hypothetical protein